MIMLMMFFNFIFLISKNLLILGLILIFQTTLLSMFMGMINLTFWLSFIIFLIFVGGMLILFMYVISLMNNQFLKKMKYYFITVIILMINMNYYYNNYEMMIFNKLNLNNEISLNLIKLYNMPNMIMNMILVIYLFLMMIIISKIINLNMGPLYKF
uniref:NADH dehydrogenase subunit 6 n=1 Tax=Rhopalomyia pomum TaxID=608481 RepID=C7FIL4_RHOPM|nr:NADH dehydrogenase subunit 6 [Rhopalomyia pomum]